MEQVCWGFDVEGDRLVLRNGTLETARRTVGLRNVRFSSKAVTVYARRSPKAIEVLPIPYLRGLSIWRRPPRVGRPRRYWEGMEPGGLVARDG